MSRRLLRLADWQSRAYLTLMPIAPWGFRKLLQHVYHKYTKHLGIDIIITENGFAVLDEGKKPFEDRINDVERQHYYAGYIKELIEAVVDDGIPIGGYMAWSLLE